jgi:hypothetical protein
VYALYIYTEIYKREGHIKLYKQLHEVRTNFLGINSQHSDQQNAQHSFLDIYIIISHKTFLHVSIPKGSSSGNQQKQYVIL